MCDELKPDCKIAVTSQGVKPGRIYHEVGLPTKAGGNVLGRIIHRNPKLVLGIKECDSVKRQQSGNRQEDRFYLL